MCRERKGLQAQEILSTMGWMNWGSLRRFKHNKENDSPGGVERAGNAIHEDAFYFLHKITWQQALECILIIQRRRRALPYSFEDCIYCCRILMGDRSIAIYPIYLHSKQSYSSSLFVLRNITFNEQSRQPRPPPPPPALYPCTFTSALSGLDLFVISISTLLIFNSSFIKLVLVLIIPWKKASSLQ